MRRNKKEKLINLNIVLYIPVYKKIKTTDKANQTIMMISELLNKSKLRLLKLNTKKVARNIDIKSESTTNKTLKGLELLNKISFTLLTFIFIF